jgi:hypothetical protein
LIITQKPLPCQPGQLKKPELMSTLSEPSLSAPQRNPLLWIGLVVAGLIIFFFLGSDRPGPGQNLSVSQQAATSNNTSGEIDRDLLIPPGMRARQSIEATRSVGKPYPLSEIFEKAKFYQEEGSLADAHILFFFSAREGHLESMMEMGAMSDPTQFRPENSLLDQADAVQSYKWYQKAALTGYQPAIDSLNNLRQWALDAAESGNPYARQLLLNLK